MTGRSHKLSDRIRKGIVGKTIKTPVSTLKDLQVKTSEMGETDL